MLRSTRLLIIVLAILAVWETLSLIFALSTGSSSTIASPSVQCGDVRQFAHFTATNYSRATRPLDDFLVGLDTLDPQNEGICRLPEGCGPNCVHFPHVAQFLLKCFSYWNQQPAKTTQQRILVTSLVNENPWKPFFRPAKFNRALILLLYRRFGVRIVNSDPYNNSVIGSDDWDSYTWGDPVQDTKAWRDVIVPRQRSIQCSSPRIRILNRRKTRSIRNVEDVSQYLESHLGLPVSIFYFEKATFSQQVNWISTADILVSPHGAQLTTLSVLPPCASVLELFPVGYYTPKFFGSLAAASLHDHYTAYNGMDARAEMHNFYENHTQRVMARSVNFCLRPQDIAPMVEEMLQKWRTCCRNERGTRGHG